MLASFFIARPILSWVISIVIFLGGLAALLHLPIAQYPPIVPPEVVVTTNYPGANAQVVATSVAAPIEDRLNGVPGMIYMHSVSANSGQLTLTATFEVGTDPDEAAIEINNRVQSALTRLPASVRQQGVTVNKRSSAILQVISIISPNGQYDTIQLSNYALINIIDDLKRLNGVGEVLLFGAKDYSMRIWTQPDKLAHYNLTASDIIQAISEQNSQFAAGQFSQEPTSDSIDFTYSTLTDGQLTTPQEFENILLRTTPDGAALRLRDVARVELGALDYSFMAQFDGQPAVAMGVFLQPGANALAVTKLVQSKIAELSSHFPSGIEYRLPFDTTRFVKIAIGEVIQTFAEAIILVALVVYLFLQNIRATLIPLIAVPVSLVGTFAGMYYLGFSVNLLTLFGLVLAIGIVVDDAIVVLENFERTQRTTHLPPIQAAIAAMKEVTGPIIAIVLVLAAVFIPVAFIGGLAGEMYRQFAVTISISVFLSGLVALTLVPTLCARFIQPSHDAPNRFFQKFNAFFERRTFGYLRLVRYTLNHPKLSLCGFALMLALSAFLMLRLPSSLVPEEDQGYLIAVPNLLPGASLQRTIHVADGITKYLLKEPTVDHVISFSGLDFLSNSLRPHCGVAFVTLKHWSERTAFKDAAPILAKRFMAVNASVQDSFTFLINPPAIIGISSTGGLEFYIQNRSGKPIQELSTVLQDFMTQASQLPELAPLRTTFAANVPQYAVNIDRDQVKTLQVPIDRLFATLQSNFGTVYVNDFTLYDRLFRVMLQADASFRKNPDNLHQVFVRSQTGSLIPLSSLVSLERIVGPDIVERFNMFTSAKLFGSAASGYSSGQAIQALEQLAKRILPTGYTLSWIGTAYQEKLTSNSSSIAFAFGIIMIFLILAAQYERWSLPIAVIASVPFAVFGSLAFVWLRGLSNDIYFQIGLVTLIGLSAKNAILIVEFAAHKHSEGLSLHEAALTAAELRFRPIIMTSFAFILGCLPLAISSGAGAASRHSIGTGVIGGMLASTLLATIFVPLFFVLVSSISERSKPTPHV